MELITKRKLCNFFSILKLRIQFFFLTLFVPASINTLVSPLGGILSAAILDQLGRKLTLVIVNVLSIVSWALIYFSSRTDFDSMFWSIMLGRFLIGETVQLFILCFFNTQMLLRSGVTIGLSSSPAAGNTNKIFSPKHFLNFIVQFSFFQLVKTVYSAEIATPKLRGRLTVLTSLAIAIGILMIYILGYIFPVFAHTHLL